MNNAELVRVIERAMLNVERDLCVQFFGLDGANIWVSAEEILAQGADMKDFLIHCGIDSDAAKEIVGRDFIYITADGFAGNLISGVSFDWDKFAELSKAMGNYDDDVIDAAIHCGIEFSKIEEAYKGYFRTFRDFAENHFEEYHMESIPEAHRHLIDFDAHARDLQASSEYYSHDGHVFANI